MTLGFTTIVPEKPFKDLPMIAFPDNLNKSKSTDKQPVNLSEKRSRDSSPEKKKDDTKMEFILPAPLAIRRRISRKV